MDAYFIPVIKFLLIYYYFFFRRTSYKGGRNWDNFDTLRSRQINTRERCKCIFYGEGNRDVVMRYVSNILIFHFISPLCYLYNLAKHIQNRFYFSTAKTRIYSSSFKKWSI